MLSSSFIKKVLEKVKVDKVSKEDLKNILFDIQKDRELYESIFESMVEGVIVLDDVNNIQYINSKAMDMFGLDGKSIIGEDISNIIDSNEIIDFLNKAQKSKMKDHNKEIEIEHNDDEKDSNILRLNVFPLSRRGKISGIIIMLLDITTKKREQDKLRRAETLASLTTLAAGVAHEIKNPLSSIHIHIQIMERFIDELPNKHRDKFGNIVTVISEEIDRLNRIVSDFLFSVRPTVLNKKMVDMEELINELLQLTSSEIKEKGIRTTVKVQKDFPEVICDPNYIKNAFLNILKNAIEACDNNDKITISLYRDNNRALVNFIDTGPGIPKNKINKIFEPYYTTKDFGTGLGLTISYKIIKEHKGDISVTSTKNKGTNFKISLPIFDESVRLLEEQK